MSLLLGSKQYVEILGLVMVITLIVARILVLMKLTTNNTSTGTGTGTEIQLSEGNIAGVTIGSNVQLDLESIITM